MAIKEKAPETIVLCGPCSTFGGPDDTGVAPGEGLAMIGSLPTPDDPRRALFLPVQPVGTKGLARRLDPKALYCAIRYPYDHRKDAPDWRRWLVKNQVALRNPANGKTIMAHVADWGPSARTGRTVDLSPGAAKALGVKTDDRVEVILERGI